MSQTKDTNPFDYSRMPDSVVRLMNNAHSAEDCAMALKSSVLWMRAFIVLFVLSVSIWTVLAAVELIRSYVAGFWKHDSAVALAIATTILIASLWPGYWDFKAASRIHRAIEEQTLSSIADVLEAQRSFWQALGILVLLAIAAIIVAATYPSWGL